MSDISPSMQEELSSFEDTYADMFGEVPPLPKAKFEFSASVDPEGLKLAEQLRAHAFYNDVFDMKTTQLMLFSMLTIKGGGAAKYHALAARRAGASWKELQMVVDLAAAVAASGPMNEGGALLNKLKKDEDEKN